MLAKGAQTLPGKVAHDYKALAKLYDARQHRKGLKNAEKILEKHPEHPQTNAMKALFELGLGEEDKAEVTAKMALMKSKMSSMFCWHTYGTVMKQKKNFFEAAKCFQQAISFEKDNMQLLRETASLQVQVRDHNNHVATRFKILQLKPNLIHNWVGFAVAHHLKGDFEQLYKALTSIQNLRHSAQMKPIEISHYFIYRVIAFTDGQKHEQAFEELTKNKDKIVDQDVWHELMYKCCIKLNKKQKALECLEFLIKKYTENIEFMKEYQKIANLTPREVYKKFGTDFNSKIARLYQISHITDETEFRKEFIQFIKPYYQKNLISLFAEIQILYETTKFENVIEEVFLASQASLKQNKYIDGTQAPFPSEYLWSLYLLAQHFSRNFETLNKAYDYINRAIEHTMTVTEFYVIKAEIQYKLHRNVDAIKTINEARKTDLADRYMNNICIKFILKCQKPSLAEDILRLFMRDEASMYELQNQWFIIQIGKAFLRMKNYPAGLRHLNFIEKQFIDIASNQIDFHTYCIRKWTLKEYIQYISFNDNIYKDKKYVQAASYAIDSLFEYARQLEIQANKPVETQKEEEQAKKKKKKSKAKVPQVEQLTPDEAFRKKIDYFGKDYEIKIKANPLQEAYIYSKNITSAQYTNKSNKKQNKLYARAFASSIKTFIHYNKPLLVIKALKKLLRTESDPFLELITSVKSIIYLQSALANQKTSEVSKQFIKEYLAEILGQSKDAKEYFATVFKKLPAAFDKQLRIREIELVLKGTDTRDGVIQYLKDELNNIIITQNKNANVLQQIFYLVHRLEFYGQFTKQLKDQLNSLYGDQTTYFTQWSQAIDKLPQSTWGIFWLSDYDIQRQEEEQNQEGKKQKSKEESKIAA